MFGTINSNASDKPKFDRLEKFRNKESLKEATDFLCNNNDEAAEMLARQYKDRDGKTLGKKYEEAHEKNEEFPKVAYLLVLPILYKMYLQYKENEADAALNGKKDEYEAFLKSVVEKGKNTPESIQQELDTYSKEQFREMSKQIIEKQKGLFSDKIKELSLDEITKVANNIQTQISNGKDIDIKTLANCLSGPAQNAQVSGQSVANNGLSNDKQTILQPAQTAQVNLLAKPNPNLIIQNQAQQLAEEEIQININDAERKNAFSYIKNQIIEGKAVKQESLCAISGVKAAMENSKNIVISSGTEKIAVKIDDKGKYQCSFLQ